MILIIGGAYQGKLDFAKEAFGITDADIYACSTDEIDFSKRCIDQIEEFTAHRANPVEYFEQTMPRQNIEVSEIALFPGHRQGER